MTAPTVRQIKALRHYSAELAIATYTPITADLLGQRRTRECGCTYRRLTVPGVGGITEAWEIQERCAEHGGSK